MEEAFPAFLTFVEYIMAKENRLCLKCKNMQNVEKMEKYHEE